MTDLKFTPAPWSILGSMIMASGHVDTFDGPVMGSIAQAFDTEEQDEDGRNWRCQGSKEGNLRLIATAPELYRTLELAYNQLCKVSLMGTDTIMVLEMIEDTMDLARGKV